MPACHPHDYGKTWEAKMKAGRHRDAYGHSHYGNVPAPLWASGSISPTQTYQNRIPDLALQGIPVHSWCRLFPMLKSCRKLVSSRLNLPGFDTAGTGCSMSPGSPPSPSLHHPPPSAKRDHPLSVRQGTPQQTDPLVATSEALQVFRNVGKEKRFRRPRSVHPK